MNIDGQVISFVEMVCEGRYYSPININSHYQVFQKINQITQLYLWGQQPMAKLTRNAMIMIMFFHPL